MTDASRGGGGRPHDIVLLHGWGMSRAVWQALTAQFPPDARLHALDLPGYGAAPPPARYDLCGLADCVADRAPARCDVVGWSLGAHVALQWAFRRPLQVRRLALIGATPCFVSRGDWPHGMDSAVFGAFESLLREDCGAALERFAALQTQGEAYALKTARQLRAAVARDVQPQALEHGLAILRLADLRPLMGGVGQPVHVLHGRRDALVPCAAAEYFRSALPAARVEIMPEAAHAPFISQPAAVAARLADFFHE